MLYDEMTQELFRRFNAKCLWSEPGPKDTRVERMECFVCAGVIIITQKYKDGGWEILAPVSDSLRPEANFAALERRIANYPHEVIIELEGGVIHEIFNIPPNLHIRVKDFDIDGVEESELKTADNGEQYYESVYVGAESDMTVSDEAKFKLTREE